MAEKRKRGRPPKDKVKPKYSVPPELWCGITKANGESCRASRTKKDDGTYTEYCFQHQEKARKQVALGLLPGAQFDLPPDMPMDGLRNVRAVLADTINRVRMGKLPTKIGQTVAQLAGHLIKTEIAIEKLDPKKAAVRKATEEEMLNRMKDMTLEDALRIAAERDQELLQDYTTVAEKSEEEVESVEEILKTDATRSERHRIARLMREVDEVIENIDSDDVGDILKGTAYDGIEGRKDEYVRDKQEGGVAGEAGDSASDSDSEEVEES